MPTRDALSAYAGPMPRLVVPSLRLPSRRSVRRSSSWWYGRIRWALPLSFSREQSTPLRGERVDLGQQHRRVDHHAVADDRGDVVVEDSARHQLESEGLAVDDDRVTRVVAALVADDQVHLLGDEVGELALALVAPLGADDDRRRHGASFKGRRDRASLPAARASPWDHKPSGCTDSPGPQVDGSDSTYRHVCNVIATYRAAAPVAPMPERIVPRHAWR